MSGEPQRHKPDARHVKNVRDLDGHGIERRLRDPAEPDPIGGFIEFVTKGRIVADPQKHVSVLIEPLADGYVAAVRQIAYDGFLTPGLSVVIGGSGIHTAGWFADRMGNVSSGTA